jgi:hypothetical protein
VEAGRPDHGHKWQEGDRRPMRGEETANSGADAIVDSGAKRNGFKRSGFGRLCQAL